MILSKENIKSINLDELIEESFGNKEYNSLLLIVPTNRKTLSLRKQIVSANKVTSQLIIETLNTITQKLLKLSVNYKIISDAAASVLIKQSFNSAKLNYFNVYAEKIPYGTLDRIKNLISKLKEHGISSDKILSEAKESLTGGDAKKAIDIAVIYELYKKKCRERKFFEIGDVYEELLILGEEQLRENFYKLFPNVKTVVFYGFDEFTKLEIEIVSVIANICKTFVDFDYYGYNYAIFNHLKETINILEANGFNILEDKSIDYIPKFKSLIRDNLFKTKKLEKIKDFKQKIKYFTAENRYKEIEYIAKEIKEILNNNKIEPNKICVAFNLIQGYSSIVRSIFAKYQIPLNLTDRLKLDNSDLVILLVNLLSIVLNNYYYQDIFKVLNHTIIKKYLGNSFSLILAAGELKITIDKNEWQTILETQINKYKIDDSNSYYDENKKETYKEALTIFNKLVELLSPFEKALTIDEFLTELKELINKLNFNDYLFSANHETNKKNIAAVTEFLEITTEIFLLLKSEAEDKKFGLAYFIDNIKTACKWARYNPVGVSDYGVLVTTVNEIRGLQFDYLFIGGLVDGIFPTKYQPEIIDKNKFIRKNSSHIIEEQYHFYQTLLCFNSTTGKSLYLTNFSYDGESEKEESTFVTEFKNLFEITEITEPANYFDKKIYSTDELHTLYGSLLLNGEFEKAKELEQGYKNLISGFDIKRIIGLHNIRIANYLEESEYNGYILGSLESENTNNIIKQQLTKILEKQFSESQIDEYAKCHFKYFAKRLLKCAEIQEPKNEIEFYVKGNVVHEILFDFYNVLQKENLIIKGCSDTTFAKIKNILFEIANKKIEDSEISLPIYFFEKEQLIGTENDIVKSILYRYLVSERERQDDYLPKYFEVKFGYLKTEQKDAYLSTEKPIEIANIKFVGRIDRIDVDENTNSIIIIDYKTGKTDVKENDIKEGYENQLPVYLIAAEKLLEEKKHKEYKAYKIEYHKLVYDKDKFGKKEFPKKDIALTDAIAYNENTKKIAISNIENLVEELKLGRFNLIKNIKKYDDFCKKCDYTAICRINEVKN